MYDDDLFYTDSLLEDQDVRNEELPNTKVLSDSSSLTDNNVNNMELHECAVKPDHLSIHSYSEQVELPARPPVEHVDEGVQTEAMTPPISPEEESCDPCLDQYCKRCRHLHDIVTDGEYADWMYEANQDLSAGEMSITSSATWWSTSESGTGISGAVDMSCDDVRMKSSKSEAESANKNCPKLRTNKSEDTKLRVKSEPGAVPYTLCWDYAGSGDDHPPLPAHPHLPAHPPLAAHPPLPAHPRLAGHHFDFGHKNSHDIDNDNQSCSERSEQMDTPTENTNSGLDSPQDSVNMIGPFSDRMSSPRDSLLSEDNRYEFDSITSSFRDMLQDKGHRLMDYTFHTKDQSWRLCREKQRRAEEQAGEQPR